MVSAFPNVHPLLYMYQIKAVVDPGFSREGGANSKDGCEKLLFGQFFPKNCMKLALDLEGVARVPGAPRPLDPSMKNFPSFFRYNP